MTTRIHPNARITPRTREEIRHSNLTQSEIMARYSISKATARKWMSRDDFADRSHRAHTLQTTLSSAQEALGFQSPVEALKGWQKDRPELFTKRVYKRAELDT